MNRMMKISVEAVVASKNGSFSFQLSPVVPCVREQKYILNFFSLFRPRDVFASRPHKGQLVTTAIDASAAGGASDGARS